MTSLTNLAHHIDYKKLVQEMNKTGLSVLVKNNSSLPKVIIQASEIANVIIPIGLLATAVIGTPLLGLKAYQWYRQFQNRKREYPKATSADIQTAYDNIQKIKGDLKKTIEIPGRPEEKRQRMTLGNHF